MSPKISVVMPVFNGADHLREAIDSILAQTFKDFEFIIVDDASTDNSRAIIKSYLDQRIKLFVNENNLGTAGSLNEAIGKSAGEYIARMDADDISLPDRFETQVKFLDENPQIAMVGTWARVIGDKAGLLIAHPTDPAILRSNLIFHASFVHPSVMIRRGFFSNLGFKYDPEFRQGQDYKLWVQMSEKLRLANINKVLIYYRTHRKQTKTTDAAGQASNAFSVRREQILKLGITPTERELAIYMSICNLKTEGTITYLRECENWLLKILEANKRMNMYDPISLRSVIADEWLKICKQRIRPRFQMWKIYWHSPLRQGGSFSKIFEFVKIIVRSFLN